VSELNIALISTDKLPVPPIAGGAVQLYIEGILPYISKHHRVTVFSIDHPGLKPEEEKDGVKHVRLAAKDRAEYVSNLKGRLTEGFDLVHVFNRPAWVVELCKGLPDTKFSLSLHNEMFVPEKLNARDAENCISRVEFISTVSRFIAEGVKKLYPEAERKLHVVYAGADTEKFKPAWSPEGIANKNRLKKKYNLEKYKIVLFVGRLSVKKGVHVLLKAMQKVMETHTDVALVLVGSKWYGGNRTDEYVRSVTDISKSLPGPVVMTGFLPPDEIPAYYNMADIFVCPSQWNEPLARVHYEAMAAGLPIITTNRGGNPEVIIGEGNGLVLNEYANPDAMADYIEYLLGKPHLIDEMGRKGYALAMEKYNWKRVAEDLLKLFARVEEKIGRKSPSPTDKKEKKKTDGVKVDSIDYSMLTETYRNYLKKWHNRYY